MKPVNVRWLWRSNSVLSVVCAWLLGSSLTNAAVLSSTNATPLLAAVRHFADEVPAPGRDVYGKPTLLFVDGISVETREPVKWKWADGKAWVLRNLANQQRLFRTLDGLSRLTGDPRYKDAAREAMRYAFDHLRYGTQNNGGLLAWGGHLACSAMDDLLAFSTHNRSPSLGTVRPPGACMTRRTLTGRCDR